MYYTNSFLDTWGNDDFQNNLPLEQKSYFSVLGVVSKELRDQCTVVLDQVLEREKFGEGTPGGRYKIPLQLLLDRSDADTKAGNTIGDILKAFNLEHTNLKNKIDPFVADAVKAANQDLYLEALKRLMDIERNCFTIQSNFLKTGKVPPQSCVFPRTYDSVASETGNGIIMPPKRTWHQLAEAVRARVDGQLGAGVDARRGLRSDRCSIAFGEAEAALRRQPDCLQQGMQLLLPHACGRNGTGSLAHRRPSSRKPSRSKSARRSLGGLRRRTNRPAV